MCITTGNNTCDAMAKLHLCGNIIPQIWHKTIVSEKTGKADLIAINILADIAYWYRPAEERDELTGETVGYHPKFAADILQRSYDDLADHFGISKGQAKCAVIRLEQLGVVRRVFRKISVGGISIPNVLFLALNVDRLRELGTARKLSVVAVGIGNDADMEMLAKVSPRQRPVRLNGLQFREFFAWLSRSVANVSASLPGEEPNVDLEALEALSAEPWPENTL